MEINYGSKGVYNYIEVSINQTTDDIIKNSYKLCMLENNSIEGMVSPIIDRLDDDIYIKYPVNSMFVFDKYLIKVKPDIGLLERVLKNICSCIDESEKYLLNTDDLVLSPGYMLWDDKSKNVKMIYAPGYGMDIKVQLKRFMEYIMQIFDYKSANGIMKMHRLYEMISEEKFDIKDLKAGLINDSFATENNNLSDTEYNNKTVSEISRYDSFSFDDNYTKNDDTRIISNNSKIHEILIAANTLAAVIFYLGYLFLNKHKGMLFLFLISILFLTINTVIYFLKKDKEEEIDAESSMKEFEEHLNKSTESIEPYGDNFDLNEACRSKNYVSEKKAYKLIPLNDGTLEPIVLNEDIPQITIGRGYKEVDYRLNKEQISRVHARVALNDKGIYIEDRNSTNGTYINSKRLEAFLPESLTVGDIVRLANEEFFVS